MFSVHAILLLGNKRYCTLRKKEYKIYICEKFKLGRGGDVQ
jgi:hypothetical protein